MAKYIEAMETSDLQVREDMIKDILLFPLAYQQTKANNGEMAVKPSQIIA